MATAKDFDRIHQVVPKKHSVSHQNPPVICATIDPLTRKIFEFFGRRYLQLAFHGLFDRWPYLRDVPASVPQWMRFEGPPPRCALRQSGWRQLRDCRTSACQSYLRLPRRQGLIIRFSFDSFRSRKGYHVLQARRCAYWNRYLADIRRFLSGLRRRCSLKTEYPPLAPRSASPFCAARLGRPTSHSKLSLP
jgi:hypothetical protein